MQLITAAITAIKFDTIKNFRRPSFEDKSPPEKLPIKAPTGIMVEAMVTSSKCSSSHPSVDTTGSIVILKHPI